MEESIKIAGMVHLTVRDFDGKVTHREGKNLVVSGGQNLFASLLAGQAVDPPSHIAIGSSNITPGKSQTGLQGTEHERVTAVVTVSDNTITATATLGSGISEVVTCGEFGLFNGTAPTGIMISRWTTPEFTLPETSTVDIIWRLTLGG